MSTITLKLIFFGLISIVDSGGEGTALIVDGEKACHDLSMAERLKVDCRQFKHEPHLYLLEGDCEDPNRCDASEGDQQPIEVRRLKLDVTGELSIVEDAWPPWNPNSKAKPVAGSHWIYPKGKDQSRSFLWVTGMLEASGKNRAVNPNCLGLDSDRLCPVQARFTLPYGEARACHFYHCNRERTDCQGKDQRLYGYTFPAPVGSQISTLRQAIPDTAIVEMELCGYDHVTLKNGAGDTIKLEPDANDQIVVALSNTPKHETRNTETKIRHFELYYALADRLVPSHNRAVPERRWQGGVLDSDKLGSSTELFECEPYITALTPVDLVPHDPQECIVSKYP